MIQSDPVSLSALYTFPYLVDVFDVDFYMMTEHTRIISIVASEDEFMWARKTLSDQPKKMRSIRLALKPALRPINSNGSHLPFSCGPGIENLTPAHIHMASNPDVKCQINFLTSFPDLQ